MSTYAVAVCTKFRKKPAWVAQTALSTTILKILATADEPLSRREIGEKLLKSNYLVTRATLEARLRHLEKNCQIIRRTGHPIRYIVRKPEG